MSGDPALSLRAAAATLRILEVLTLLSAPNPAPCTIKLALLSWNTLAACKHYDLPSCLPGLVLHGLSGLGRCAEYRYRIYKRRLSFQAQIEERTGRVGDQAQVQPFIQCSNYKNTASCRDLRHILTRCLGYTGHLV